MPVLATRASLLLGMLSAILPQYAYGFRFIVASTDHLPACPHVDMVRVVGLLIIVDDDSIFAVSFDPIPSRVQIPALSASHVVSAVVACHDDLLSSFTQHVRLLYLKQDSPRSTEIWKTDRKHSPG